ncbi:coiled-coil domain-containing protein 152 [Xenentodon cancila]
MLEIMLEDANRLIKFHITKEKSLIEVENERLKNDVTDLKQQNKRTAEVGEAEVRRLLSQMRAEEERHQRELEVVRHQCSKEVEDARRKALSEVDARDAEVKKLLEEKDADLEEMKTRLKEHERERQTELLKLQMEAELLYGQENDAVALRGSVEKLTGNFGAKLARVQSAAQRSQQPPPQGSNLLPHSVFKRKLQFFQEEKNKEVSALRQRIKELEENQLSSSLSDIRLKRRKI